MAPTKDDKKLNFLYIIKQKTIKENKLHTAQVVMAMPHKA